MERNWTGAAGDCRAEGVIRALVANSPLGSAYAVDQFPGADFGAKLQACLGALSASYGGTCDARNFTGTLSMGSNLTISTANATVLLPCATISTANQMIVTAGTRNVSLRGCALRGSKHGKRKPGRHGVSVFGNRRDGTGGRSDLCGGYDGISPGQRGDQYHGGSSSAQRRGWRPIARRRWTWKACICWVTQTRRA